MVSLKLREGEEFIKLQQVLKAAGLCQTGSEAKYAILDGLVEVNGETEIRRGRKIHPGDKIKFEDEVILITDSE